MRAYLAGPDVFLPNATQVARAKLAAGQVAWVREEDVQAVRGV